MAKIKVKLEGDDIIDGASIFLEDPLESIERALDRVTDTEWEITARIPIEDELDYSLHVVAFTGTHFKCTITNLDSGNELDFEGVTGRRIKHRAHIIGSQKI